MIKKKKDGSKIWFHIHYVSGYFSGRLMKLDRSEMIVLILSSILPDFDVLIYFIFSGFQDPAPFHAGITHILLIGILLSTILAACSFLILKWKKSEIGYGKLFKFIILGVVGICLHLFLDIITIANEYGPVHHLYFWPFLDFSYHMDIMLADIFPRLPYFNFDKLIISYYAQGSFQLVQFLTLIINGVFFSVVLYEWLPPRKQFLWDVFMYEVDPDYGSKRNPWINDQLELILNIGLSLIFFAIFVLNIDNSLRAILGSL